MLRQWCVTAASTTTATYACSSGVPAPSDTFGPMGDLLITVAPTGAETAKADCPQLPTTLAELVETARRCEAAGAGMIHVHIRDGEHRPTLDQGRLRETVAALKTAQARVFSFTRLGPVLSLSNCGTGRRFTQPDAMSYGWSKPYFGKTPIAEATGGKNFDLDAVRTKKVSLTDTINEVVLESHCAGPPR